MRSTKTFHHTGYDCGVVNFGLTLKRGQRIRGCLTQNQEVQEERLGTSLPWVYSIQIHVRSYTKLERFQKKKKGRSVKYNPIYNFFFICLNKSKYYSISNGSMVHRGLRHGKEVFSGEGYMQQLQ